MNWNYSFVTVVRNSDVDEISNRLDVRMRSVWPFGLHPAFYQQRVGIFLGVCCTSDKTPSGFPIKKVKLHDAACCVLSTCENHWRKVVSKLACPKCWHHLTNRCRVAMSRYV